MLLAKLVVFEVKYFLYHFAKVIKNRMVVIQMGELLQCLLHYLELYHQAYYSQLASMEVPIQILQKGFIEDYLPYLQLMQSCQNSNPPSNKKTIISKRVNGIQNKLTPGQTRLPCRWAGFPVPDAPAPYEPVGVGYYYVG